MSEPRNRQRLSLNKDARQGPAVEERLHKVLANAGLGSRRLLEERIGSGEIRVNGAAADIGSSIKAGDRVELDGKAFIAVATEPEDLVYLNRATATNIASQVSYNALNDSFAFATNPEAAIYKIFTPK